jgi:hypothetical protein
MYRRIYDVFVSLPYRHLSYFPAKTGLLHAPCLKVLMARQAPRHICIQVFVVRAAHNNVFRVFHIILQLGDARQESNPADPAINRRKALE